MVYPMPAINTFCYYCNFAWPFVAFCGAELSFSAWPLSHSHDIQGLAILRDGIVQTRGPQSCAIHFRLFPLCQFPQLPYGIKKQCRTWVSIIFAWQSNKSWYFQTKTEPKVIKRWQTRCEMEQPHTVWEGEKGNHIYSTQPT